MPHTTLVDTTTLTAHIEDPDWIVFDCRHDLAQPDAGAAEYATNHIPGAHFAHLDRDLSGIKTGRNGRHPLPDPAALAEKLGLAGLRSGKQLVAYDAQGGTYAARLWWLARWLGHRDAAVLDGGWQRWLAEGKAVSSATPANHHEKLDWRPGHDWVNADFILKNGHEILLIDARAPDRFRGENETLDPVGGRIPGAHNRFFRDNLTAEGRFKPADTLKQEFGRILSKASPEKAVHSCGSGVSACHNLLAMEIAGMPGSRLYPGSWSEWCADPARPIERGPA